MNIPEWQSKMIRSSPKSIMKHANKQLEMLGASNGDPENYKDAIKAHFASDEKKLRKGNIDILTGKRKYTKKLMKLDAFSNSKFICVLGKKINLMIYLLLELKERKKHKKRQGSISGNPHVPRKYTFKKRLPKVHDGMSEKNFHSIVPNGLNGGREKHFESLARSKNSSPVPIIRPEK